MNADLDAERAILGAVITSAGRLYDTLGLTGEDFHGEPHQVLWEAIGSLLASGKPLDITVLLAHLGKRASQFGPLLADCVTAACVPATAHWHAGHLRALTMRRRIAGAADALRSIAGGTDADLGPDELAELARGQVDHHVQRTVGTGGAISFLDAVLSGVDRWNVPDTDVLATNWLDLDEMLTGGLRPGHLCVVGARPGIGKSLLATELARNVAPRASVLIASLEMSEAEVTNRIASAMAGVPLAKLTAGAATEQDMDRLSRLAGRVADWQLVIDDRASVGVAAIRGKARDLAHAFGGLGLVIVDYLQLAAPADPRAPREQQVASISRGLKLLARDLRVPVVALAQVNRGPAQRADRRPTLSDLRESGAIEADADEVLFLHREDDDHGQGGDLEVIVAKNRHGATGTVHLGWQPWAGRITNLSRAAA